MNKAYMIAVPIVTRYEGLKDEVRLIRKVYFRTLGSANRYIESYNKYHTRLVYAAPAVIEQRPANDSDFNKIVIL